MKKCFCIILMYCMCVYVVAQHPNLEAIKSYCHSMDRVEFVNATFAKHVDIKRDQIVFFRDSIGISVDTLTQNKWFAELNRKLESINICNSMLFLVPKFKNAVDYNFDKNIYDFLYVDTARTEIRYYNTRKKEVTILSETRFVSFEYSNRKRDFRKTEKLLATIDKKKPEVLLIGSWIFATNGYPHYLFIKDNKIYIYRSKNGDIHELNEFVHKFFAEKEFRERAILNEKGLIRVGG